MEHNSQTDFEKREERKRRRKKSQISAYITLFIMIAVIAAGIVLGVKLITDMSREKPEDDKQSLVDEMLGTEETIQVPEPSETVPELTDEEKLDEIVNAGIEVMPLEDKVAGLFLVTPESITGLAFAV